MFLKKIELFNFKNYSECQYEFSEGLNFILGKNGIGKSNLLDSIYFSCITKSFSGLKDEQLIKNGEQFSVCKLSVDDQIISIGLQENTKKAISVDKIIIERLTDFIGNYPVVFVSPNDHDYIRDASEARRKLIDEYLCQIDSIYLKSLLEYNRLLKSRNQLLKMMKERKSIDTVLLETFDDKLCNNQIYISSQREKSATNINKILKEFYQIISNESEIVSLQYIYSIDHRADYLQLMKENWQLDFASGRTSIGCHKDDYGFEIEGNSLKKYGSQGQQKSFMLALQLSKHTLLKETLGKNPFLLLDDVFDKLDNDRIQKVIEIVSKEKFGQVFITDARPDRTREMIEKNNIQCKSIFL